MSNETRGFLDNGEVKLEIVQPDPQLVMQGMLYGDKTEMVVEKPKWLGPGTYAFKVQGREKDLVQGTIAGMGRVTIRVQNEHTRTTSVGTLSPPLR